LKGQTYYYALAVSNSAGEGNLSLPRYEIAIETSSPPRDLSVHVSGELSLNTTWLAPLDNGDGLVASLSTPRPMHKYVVEIDDVSPAFLNVNYAFDLVFPITTYHAKAPALV